MKRTERRHLKENELQNLARQAREGFESRRRETTFVVGALAVVGLLVAGYFAWHQRVESRAHRLLADALVVQSARVGTPVAPGMAGAGSLSYLTERDRAQAAVAKFKATADAYPSTDAGIFARYQEGATWAYLGNLAQAISAYQQVIGRAGDSFYGQMARLGMAQAQALDGKYEQAINAYKELAQRKDGPLPVDGILMQLGKAYLDAGKRADAQQTFTRLVEEYPESPFTGDARRELETLKKT
jgi:TolA-binding protein